MEQTMLISLLISSLFLVLYSVVRAFYSIWWKPKMLEKYLKLQGINGTSYKLSFGDMKEYVKQITEAWSKPASLDHHIVSRVDPFTDNIVQTYGKMSMFWLGATPRLNVMEPELVKEVLSNKLGHFQKPPINPQILILTNGLTTLEGEKWAAHRRIINPAFHLDKLKGMLPVISDSCGALVERWKKSVGVEGTCEMDVWPEFQGLAGDIICRTAFGSNYAEGNKILELQTELLVLVLESMQTLYVPGFRFLPTKKNKRRQSLNKKITSMLRALVERKDAAMNAGESPRDDLLGLLLQSNNVSNTWSYKMSIEDIIEECKQFYLAGHETTSSFLTWTMIVLAMHPDWQEKAREEVLRVCGKRNLTYEAMHQLKNITMILYEVQRLYPPVIALYLHTRKETQIGNISLPAGVDITLPILHIHHDPELWGNDVEEFKPERFSEGVAKASKDKLAFFPFGWGPRTCIGQQFATIEVKVALAVILQNFSFKLSASYTHAPNTGMTLQPQHGAQITLYQL